MIPVTELEQAAAATGPATAHPPEPHRSLAPLPAQLRHLSVEHAALLMELKASDIQLLEHLGRGRRASEIARRTCVSVNTVMNRITKLQVKTRMSFLQLAVLGYQLLGAVESAHEAPHA